MQLFIIRHAEAHPGTPDEGRELTEKGRQTVKKMAAFLKKRRIVNFDEVRHSSLARCRQTAEIIKRELKLAAELKEDKRLHPEVDAGILASWLDSMPARRAASKRSIMLVGHNPQLILLAAKLVIGEEDEELFLLKKCGVICLERNEQFRWSLSWMLSPQLLF